MRPYGGGTLMHKVKVKYVKKRKKFFSSADILNILLDSLILASSRKSQEGQEKRKVSWWRWWGS